ncbi:MAG: hypothetical protein ACREJU_17595, partial [Nitrospiraceae bacterium]
MTDLAAIPITSKQDLQLLPPEEIVTHGQDTNRLVVHKTSGSSGEPFTIRRTWFEERVFSAFRVRAMRDLGLRLTDKEASVRLVRPTNPWHNQLPLRILRALGLFRQMWVDCRRQSEDIIRALRQFRPDVLTGYPGALSYLAQIVGKDDRRVIRPRFIIVGGEVLTPTMRRWITDAFAAPLYDLYGSFEFNLIAWECQKTGELHTCDDSLIVEVLKDGRPAAMGERGEVVVTSLCSFAMPFIRYRLGDIVTKGVETCRCGQPFSTIRAVQGRMIDYFELPGGRAIHPYEISAILRRDADSWIRQFQVTQERENRIILRAVPAGTPSLEQLLLLEESVTALLGKDIEFRVILASDLHFESSGKFRVYRSLVKSAYDGIAWEHTNPSDHPLPGSRADKPVDGFRLSRMSVEYQPEFDAKSGVSSIVETLGGDHSTQIFVHGMDSIGNPAQLAITKPGFHKYPERALVVARPNDFVCVLDRVDDRYLRFLSTLGVGPHEDNIIVASKRGHRSSSTSLSDVLMSNHDALLAIRERVQRDMPVFVNPFLASPKEFEFADALGTVLGRHVHVLGGHSDTVDYVNQKHNARSKALELGVPVPEGETIELQLRQEGTALDIAP